MTTLTNDDVRKLSLIKKVDANGNVVLVACPSDFKVGTAANVSDLTVTGNSTVAGNLEVTTQPRFFVHLTDSDQSITSGDWTTVEFNTKRFDVGSSYDTSNYTFTVPKSGTYFLSSNIRINDIETSIDYIWIRFYINSSTALYGTVYRTDDVANSTIAYWTVTLATPIDLTEGDTVVTQVIAYNGGSATNVDGESGNTSSIRTWFSGYLLG